MTLNLRLERTDYIARFRSAERRLKAAGWDVINPAKFAGVLPPMTYTEILAIDEYLLNYCQAIYMLTGWQRSTGAKHERDRAQALGLEILEEREEGEQDERSRPDGES